MRLNCELRGLPLAVLIAGFLFGTGTYCGYLKEGGDCKTVANCPTGYEEIYREGEGAKISRYCCEKGTENAEESKKDAAMCRSSGCYALKDKRAKEGKFCSSIEKRWINETKLEYEEAVKDQCVVGGSKDQIGIRSLCCARNSKDGITTLLLGAEMHQFPHFASVYIATPGGYSKCGGTIYNEWYIITAHHCIDDKKRGYRPTKGSFVALDVRIFDYNNPLIYHAEEFIPYPNYVHSNSSYLIGTYNDIALIKLKEKIKFGPHIKALPLAKPGFDPFKYSDEVVIVGTGRTDRSAKASMLQRARTYIGDDKTNLNKYDLWGKKYNMQHAPGLLFVGGIHVNGKRGPQASTGDSGGPAICKDENGLALLCGIVSKGSGLEECEEMLDEYACKPGLFTEVSNYYDWIVKVAGNQSNAEVLHQPLYGAPVPSGMYEHQVRITSSSGPSCGGTLIEKDVVVTAAHCVADDRGNTKRGLKVFSGIRDLNSDTGNLISVRSVKILGGFEKESQSARPKRIAKVKTLPTPLYPYYKNDLAILKLASKVDISSSKLPKIGHAPESDGDTGEIIWTTEVSLPTNTTRSGQLQQREFQILDHKACQKRISRASHAGFDVKVDENILCGEERYNGGAQCDRELGGGLICQGDDGGDILCGVQVFRFCQLALPSAFLDISQYKNWVEYNK